MAIENSSVETGKIVIDSVVGECSARENIDSDKITKKQVISLLKKHSVKDIESVRAETEKSGVKVN